MEKHFMIDIETTGIDPEKEDLLQIGVLELDFTNGFWIPGRSIEILQHSRAQPMSEFAKKHMASLYARCNEAPWLSPGTIRLSLISFFESCGITPPGIYMMGWNASNFDLPFLFHHKCLIPSYYAQDASGKDIQMGDTHYRVYEIGGAVSLAQNALGYEERKGVIEDAKLEYELDLPVGKEHDAIWDCYNQTKLLNGLIRLVQKRRLE